MHSKIDKDRDQTEERKEMHSRIDKLRDVTEKRKLRHSAYEQTATRKHYIRKRDCSRYQKQLIATLANDTGFDVICASCLQYKSKNYCKLVSILEENQIKKFVVKNCALLKNRSNEQFVCN